MLKNLYGIKFHVLGVMFYLTVLWYMGTQAGNAMVLREHGFPLVMFVIALIVSIFAILVNVNLSGKKLVSANLGMVFATLLWLGAFQFELTTTFGCGCNGLVAVVNDQKVVRSPRYRLEIADPNHDTVTWFQPEIVLGMFTWKSKSRDGVEFTARVGKAHFEINPPDALFLPASEYNRKVEDLTLQLNRKIFEEFDEQAAKLSFKELVIHIKAAGNTYDVFQGEDLQRLYEIFDLLDQLGRPGWDGKLAVTELTPYQKPVAFRTSFPCF